MMVSRPSTLSLVTQTTELRLSINQIGVLIVTSPGLVSAAMRPSAYLLGSRAVDESENRNGLQRGRI